MTTQEKLLRLSALTITALSLTSLTTSAVAADVTLEITNVESAQGNLRIAVYDNETNFKNKSIYRTVTQPAVSGTMEIILTDVPMGEYGVMLFHDVNSNEELDSNLLGIPREPWSASMQGRSVFGPPGWDDINFTLPDAGDRIVIDMQ